MSQKHSDKLGFTLIETSIALVILATALIGIATVFLYTTGHNSGASERAMGLAVAQRKMEELRNSPFTSPELAATPGTTLTITNAGRSYNVLLKITNDSTTRKTITLEVSPINATSPWAAAPVILVTQRSALTIGPHIG